MGSEPSQQERVFSTMCPKKRHLMGPAALRVLRFRGAPFTDQGFEALARMKELVPHDGDDLTQSPAHLQARE